MMRAAADIVTERPFDGTDRPPPRPDTTDLDTLNEKFCVVREGGKTRVFTFEPHRQKDHTREVATYISFDDFKAVKLKSAQKNAYGQKDLVERIFELKIGDTVVREVVHYQVNFPKKPSKGPKKTKC